VKETVIKIMDQRELRGTKRVRKGSRKRIMGYK